MYVWVGITKNYYSYMIWGVLSSKTIFFLDDKISDQCFLKISLNICFSETRISSNIIHKMDPQMSKNSRKCRFGQSWGKSRVTYQKHFPMKKYRLKFINIYIFFILETNTVQWSRVRWRKKNSIQIFSILYFFLAECT